jgi:hypothetical protein
MATVVSPPEVASSIEMLRKASPAERLALLRELVQLCHADGSLNGGLRITDEQNKLLSIVTPMLPRTKTPLPELTDEDRAEIQRRRANRQGVMSEEQFFAEIRSRIKEREESAQS